MKTHIYITALMGFLIQVTIFGQSTTAERNAPRTPFNIEFWNAYADKLQLKPADRNEFISSHKRVHEKNQGQNNSSQGQTGKPINQQNFINAGPCVNIDFESGTLNGWNASCGFHPIFNPIGCCPNPGGQQLVTTGGVDPAGGFPVVVPGGNFSLRLGDNVNGGEADRIEQTFMVSPSNANFTYRYAVVFQDPGHVTSEQPAFNIEMLDSTGTQVPCTYYNVAAGQGIPGFFNSQNLPGVIYKPWSNVLVDLTNYIGQNITIRFSTYDCALGGHYGYAYIDGICSSFVSGTADTICSNASTNFCAPTGLGSYVWNGPGINNQTGQCLSASAVGIYTCVTTLMTGCVGPVFTYTLSHYPTPVVSFNTNGLNACAQQYTFTNTSSISNGFIASSYWIFGGGNTSQQMNPVYTFPNPGTYPVTLIATSNMGCPASTTQTVAIYPNPVPSFIAPATCKNSVVNFSNTSSQQNGSITAFNWQFSNGANSQLMNPSQTFTQSGTQNATLTITNNHNCTATTNSPVTVHPLPAVAFSAANVCQGSNTGFVNNSSISSGSIINYVWDLDGNGTSDSYIANPSYLYPNPGTYTVKLSAVSNYNCTNSVTSLVNVLANPTASFDANPVCQGQTTQFNNLSQMQPGGQVINYAWTLGNGQFVGGMSPTYLYNTAGNYTVQLTVLANNGCNSSFAGVVVVNPVPIVTFSATTACHEQATQFTDMTSINGGQIANLRWDFQNDGIWDDTLSTNPSFVYPNPGMFGARLQAGSDKGCKNDNISNVMVHANPVADFINLPSCLGDVSTFTNTSHSSDGIISANLWDYNGDNTIDNISKNPTITYTANGVFLLKLEVQTVYGCVNVKSKSMYINPKPQVSFLTPNRNGCPSFCVTFTNNSTIATGNIVNAFWNYGDGSMTEVTMGNPSHCYNTGNYDVTLMLVSDSGCRASSTKASYIVVHPKPVAGFNVNPDEVDENDPQIDVHSTAVGADAYTYFINDNNTELHNVNFIYHFKKVGKTEPMVIQVVKNQYGCADTLMKVLKFKPSFAIYVPNTFTPNGDGVNDGWFAKGVGISKYNMAIYDRWGEKIFETNEMENAWDGHTRNSATQIKQDVYVWRAQVTDVFNKEHELTGTVTLLP
jgi:gliding motility-associated-like protein